LIEGVPLAELQENLMAKTETETQERSAAGREAEKEAEDAAAPVGAAAENGEDGNDEADAPEKVSASAGGTGGRARETRAARSSRPGRRKRAHLSEAQHRRLRETVEELWRRDPKLENWTLLARAAGLSSGPAMKRAYEVNSSTTTLANLSSFARLHESWGARAIQAVRDGVEARSLEEHLRGTGAAAGAEPATTAAAVAPATRSEPGRGGAAAPTFSGASTVPAHAVDFQRLVELGQTIDGEVRSLVRASRLFEDLADDPSLPRMIRANAALARDRIRGAIDLFAAAPEATEPE
jgi:hypothetical protein